MVIGRNLREVRRRSIPEMTIARLASCAGCSPALVSRIESGEVAPSMGTLYALATALGVSAADLVDRAGPRTRAGAAIAAARTMLLLGRAPDLAAVTTASADRHVPAEWRARAFAVLARAWPPGPMAADAAERADHLLGQIGPHDAPGVAARARIEVSHAVGEAAWLRGDVGAASRRWGNGLAITAPASDIEAAWGRGSIACALARAAPGTRTAANALSIAIEALAPIADPMAVASRITATLSDDEAPPAALVLAIVSASSSALADARARLAVLTEGPTASGASIRSEVSLGRHLR